MGARLLRTAHVATPHILTPAVADVHPSCSRGLRRAIALLRNSRHACYRAPTGTTHASQPGSCRVTRTAWNAGFSRHALALGQRTSQPHPILTARNASPRMPPQTRTGSSVIDRTLHQPTPDIDRTPAVIDRTLHQPTPDIDRTPSVIDRTSHQPTRDIDRTSA